jgi:hypothetical protein
VRFVRVNQRTIAVAFRTSLLCALFPRRFQAAQFCPSRVRAGPAVGITFADSNNSSPQAPCSHTRNPARHGHPDGACTLAEVGPGMHQPATRIASAVLTAGYTRTRKRWFTSDSFATDRGQDAPGGAKKQRMRWERVSHKWNCRSGESLTMPRPMVRPSQSFHPSANSVTVSPISSTKARQSRSLQQEVGYQL